MSQPSLPDLRTEVTGPQKIPPRQLMPASRLGRHLREAAVHVVRSSSPPTMALGQRTGGDEISQQQAREVIDLALRVGEAMLATGASAADTVATVLRLAQAYGVGSVHVDITYTSITVSIHRGLHEDPLSVMRVVTVRSIDYTRLEAVQRHIEAIIDSAGPGGPTMDVTAARARLQRLLASPHPFRRWVVTLGASIMAVGVVMLFAVGPVMWVVAAVSTALVDRVQRALYRWGVAAFFTQAVSAAVPALFALVMFGYGDVLLPGISFVPSVVVISGIVVLLAGLGVLGAAQDALDGYYVTAGARGLEVLMMTLGIAVGVAVVIGIGRALGVSMEASAVVALGGSPLVSTLGAMLIALGFCLSTYAGMRTIVISVLISALAYMVFESLLALGMAAAMATAVAATLVGALAYVAYRRLHVAEAAVATAAIVAFLPGLSVYRSLYLVMQNSAATMPQAMVWLVVAISTGIALAAGLAMGAFLARRRLGLDRATLRARRRSRGHVAT
jgi:uncharacterized membrane protein YjjP (DUF1212 family)